SSKPVSSSCPRAAARAGILLVPRVCRRWCGRSSPRAFRPSWALCGTWRTPQRNRCRCLSIVTTNRAVTLRWHYRPHSANCSGTETAASGRSWRGLRFRWSVTDRHRSSRRHNDLMEEHTLDFIVRILFTGMMVFIPNSNGTQLDVVLLNVGHAHAISDGTTLTYHKPLLLARAGGCTGTCPKNDPDIATFVFGDKPTDAAIDALEAALDGGGAWQLTGSDISVVKGSGDPDLPGLDFVEGVRNGIIPTTAGERADYSWLAKLAEICPSCGLDDSILDEDPPAGLVAARFRLTTGSVFTYSIAQIGANVTPVHFKRLDGTGSASSYTQAIATWIGADIEVSGDSIQLVESKYDNSTGRTMELT